MKFCTSAFLVISLFFSLQGIGQSLTMGGVPVVAGNTFNGCAGQSVTLDIQLGTADTAIVRVDGVNGDTLTASASSPSTISLNYPSAGLEDMVQVDFQLASIVTLSINFTLKAYDNLTAPQISMAGSQYCQGAYPNNNISILSLATGGGGSYTYTWEYKKDQGEWTDVPGIAASGSASVLDLQNSGLPAAGFTPGSNWSFQLKTESQACGSIATSNVASFSIYDQLSLSEVSFTGGLGNAGSVNTSICYGTSLINLSATASNGDGNYSYQWKESTNGSTFIDLNDLSSTSSTYYGSAIQNLTADRWFQLEVTDGCGGESATKTFYIQVYDLFNAGTIQIQGTAADKSQLLCYGESISLDFENPPIGGDISSGTAGYNIQWMRKAAGQAYTAVAGGSGNELVVANSNLIGFPPGAHYFKAQISNSCGTLFTDSVKVVFRDVLLGPTISLANNQYCPGLFPDDEIVVLSLASGADSSYTYQWEYLDNGNWVSVPGISSTGDTSSMIWGSSTMNAGAEFTYGTTHSYRLKVSSAACPVTSTSNVVSFSIFDELTLSDISFSGGLGGNGYITTAVCDNTTLNSLSATASNGDGNYFYQWRQSTDNLTFIDLNDPSATTQSYSGPAIQNLTDDRWLQLEVTDGCTGESDLKTFYVQVYDPLDAGTVKVKGTASDKSRVLCYNDMTTLDFQTFPGGGDVSSGASGYAIQWMRKAPGQGYSSIAGQTGNEITVSNNDLTSFPPGIYYYKAQITNGCGTLFTDSVKVILRDALQAPIISIASNQFCPGVFPWDEIEVDLRASGADTNYSYVWEYLDNGSWTSVPGLVATSDTVWLDWTKTSFIASVEFSHGTSHSFRLKVSSAACSLVLTSNVISFTVNNALTLTEIASTGGLEGNGSATTAICNGTSLADLSAVASNGDGNYVYQWRQSSDGQNFNSIPDGSSSPSYNGVAIQNLTADRYIELEVTDGCSGESATKTFHVQVYDPLDAGTVQVKNSVGLKDTILCFGENLMLDFESLPSGSNILHSADYSTQWMILEPGQIYVPLSGGNGSEINVSNNNLMPPGTYYFKAQITNSCGTLFTDSVKVIFRDSLRSPSISMPLNQYCPGVFPNDEIKVQVPASGADSSYTYQWQYLDNGNWVSVPGVSPTSDTTWLNWNNVNLVPSVEFGYGSSHSFRLKVTSSQCTSLIRYSNSVDFSIYDQISLGNISFTGGLEGFGVNSTSICDGTSLTNLSATASDGDGNYSYEWQQSSDGDNFTNIPDAISSPVYNGAAIQNLTSDRWFKLRVTDGCSGESDSKIFQVQVYEPLQIGSVRIGGNDAPKIAICYGDQLMVDVDSNTIKGGALATLNDYVLDWQLSTSSTIFPDSSVQSGTNYCKIDSTLLPGTYYYRLRVTDETCVQEISTMIEVEVQPTPYWNTTQNTEADLMLYALDGNLNAQGQLNLCGNQQNVLVRLNQEEALEYGYTWNYGTGGSVEPELNPVFAMLQNTSAESVDLYIVDNTTTCVRTATTEVNFAAAGLAPNPAVVDVKSPESNLLICQQEPTLGLEIETIYYQWGRIDNWHGIMQKLTAWDTLQYYQSTEPLDTSRYTYYVANTTDPGSSCRSYAFYPSLGKIISIGETQTIREGSVFEIYPNPTTDRFYVKGEWKTVERIWASNLLGQKIPLLFNEKTGLVTFPDSGFTGCVVVVIETETGFSTHKVLRN